MSEVNRIIALPYLNAITPCVQIGNSLAQPAAALIEGQPGIGKSAMNASAMQIINADFRDVVLSTHEPADIGGFPWPDKDRVRFMPADWLMEAYDAAKAGRRVCIMLDDYNWAVPATQAASMRMILERRVAGVQLDPDLVRFLLVINPVEHAAGAYEMIAPIGNRVTHYKVADPGAANFINWLSGASDETASLPTFDRDLWNVQWAKSSALVQAYLRARPGALVEDPKKAEGRSLVSYATRRSWTSAALLRATAVLFGWDWAEHEVVSGSVGEPHALEFGEWARVMDLGNPEEFLKNPQSVPYDAKREDRTFAIMSAIATCAVLPQKKIDTYAERWNGGAECVAELLGRGCDKALLTVAFRTLINMRNRPKGRALTPTVLKLHKVLAPVVDLTMEVAS